MSSAWIQQIVLFAPALLLSLSVHEFAHAWVATRLGDSTPERQGRLTLSPLAHIDPFGTILFPAILLLLQAPVFGWAKPVEFQPANFTRKVTLWQGEALTAIAGPLSNILLALLSAIALRVGISFAATDSWPILFLSAMIKLNLLLAVFNFFPLPPLDGGHLIPRSLDRLKAFLTRYSFFLFALLFFLPVGGEPIGMRLVLPLVDLLERGLTAMLGLG